MKIAIVLSSSDIVHYKGSWMGCIRYCSQTHTQLSIAVIRVGDKEGRVVAECRQGKLAWTRNRTSVNKRLFRDG